MTKRSYDDNSDRRFLARSCQGSSSGVYQYAGSQYEAVTGARRFEKLDGHKPGQLDVFDTHGFNGRMAYDMQTGDLMGTNDQGERAAVPYLFSVDEEGNFFDMRADKRFDYRPEKTPESESAEAG